MRILLTGATGYIGHVIAEKLVRAGHQVVGLARNDADVRKLQEQGLGFQRGDLLDLSGLAQAVHDVDGVIHAGFAPQPDFMQALAHDRQVALTFIDALAGTQKTLIYTSGGALVSDRSVGEGTDRIVTEETTFEPSPVFAPRAAAEQDVLADASRGIRTVVLRLASVYGRGGSAFIPMMLQFTRQAGTAQYIGAGLNVWPHVHVDDVADCFLLALERAPAGSLFNVASQELTMKDLASAIAKCVGLPGKTQSITLEEAMKVWGPFAGPMAANGRLSSEKATRLLGWGPKAPSLVNELEQGSYADTRRNAG